MDHPLNVVRATMSFVKRPFFYRTPWFIALCLVILALISALAYRLRMRQVHERFDAVLAERSRLAREMHDTLIQGCAGVSAMLEGALSCDTDDHESRTHMIDYANTQIRSTMDEARQAVWNLRKGEEAPNDLATCLKQMGERLSREYSVRVKFRSIGESFPVGQQAAHELMMVAREGFFNSVLHGHPREINADICFSAETLDMVIADDGQGFDSSATPSDGHYGLQGLHERVHRLGGRVEIQSKLKQGTTLSVSVPRDKVSP
jgi:signal transduction histidine kinase